MTFTLSQFQVYTLSTAAAAAYNFTHSYSKNTGLHQCHALTQRNRTAQHTLTANESGTTDNK